MTIQEFAAKQWDRMSYDGEDPEVTVEFNGQAISDPWTDPTGRFHLTTPGAIETYGIDRFAEFCGKAAKEICPDIDRAKALTICYGISEYDILPTALKNKIYDEVTK